MKQQGFSRRMNDISYHKDKKWTNASVLKDLGKNHIFNLCEIRAKPLKNKIPLGVKELRYTSINYAY